MRLDDEKESSYVEDRRFESGGGGRSSGGGGGLSFGTIMTLLPIARMLSKSKIGWIVMIIGGVLYFKGFNPLSLVGMGGASKPATTHTVSQKEEKEATFIKKVLKTTEDVWTNLLGKYGYTYKKPTLVIYRGATHSGCGKAESQMGPFYCPNDKKVYLDLEFFDELAKRHDAPGDFAQAYVLAHEVGHHVQHLLGTLRKVHKLQQQAMNRGDKVKANHLQIPVELQADCYAGIWAHYTRNRLEPGDIEEALNAASQIGDDTLQRKAQGRVMPDSFTHGTSAQRKEWFYKGFKSGDINSCNPFRG
jgi:predicted metalloprotease